MITTRPSFAPRQAQIFISEACTEGCAYCPYTLMSQEERKRLWEKELTIKQWQQAVKFLYERLGIKLFALIGGEPSAKKGVEKLFRYMSKNLPNAEILFLTSGIPLLINQNLLDELIQAGLRNIIVSVDGIKEGPDLKVNLKKELANLKKGSERKSFLGLYFLLTLRKKYPKVPLRLVAGCIINKQTLDLILPTYYFLAKHRIYLNLCPEQTICFGGKSDTVLADEDRKKVFEIARELVKIKQQPGNFLIPSKRFFELLPTLGIKQSYKCSQMLYPTTIHLTSGGEIPFCNWHRGKIREFNVMDLVAEERSYEEWLRLWRNDKKSRDCSCSWSFVDRVNDYWPDDRMANFWYRFIGP